MGFQGRRGPSDYALVGGLVGRWTRESEAQALTKIHKTECALGNPSRTELAVKGRQEESRQAPVFSLEDKKDKIHQEGAMRWLILIFNSPRPKTIKETDHKACLGGSSWIKCIEQKDSPCMWVALSPVDCRYNVTLCLDYKYNVTSCLDTDTM